MNLIDYCEKRKQFQCLILWVHMLLNWQFICLSLTCAYGKYRNVLASQQYWLCALGMSHGQCLWKGCLHIVLLKVRFSFSLDTGLTKIKERLSPNTRWLLILDSVLHRMHDFCCYLRNCCLSIIPFNSCEMRIRVHNMVAEVEIIKNGGPS